MDSLLEKYSIEEIKDAFAVFREQKQEWADRIEESLEVFPFTFEQIMAMTATKTVGWLHPLTQISHALLYHFNVIDEPMMLHSKDLDSATGQVKKSGCHCYYASVTFDDHGITVYDNLGMGGMCPEEAKFLCAYMPLPEWMAPHLQALHAMAEEAMKNGMHEYDAPIANYTWPDIKTCERIARQDEELSP